MSSGGGGANQLWFVKGTGEAQFDPPMSLPLPGQFGDDTCSAEDALIVRTDLDGDGDHELIAFDHAAECDETGFGSSEPPQLIQINFTPGGVTVAGPAPIPKYLVPYHAIARDMDRDGFPDLIVTYSVDSTPATNAAYPLAVEIFEADTDDQEGKTFLGSDSYAASDHPDTKQVNLGNAAALGFSVGDKLVATATDDDGNTSEFSAPWVTGTVTRYVATTGSDTGNDCTNPSNKCATIAHAVSQANAGDTIDLADGTYNEPGLVIEKALIIQGQGVVVQ